MHLKRLQKTAEREATCDLIHLQVKLKGVHHEVLQRLLYRQMKNVEIPKQNYIPPEKNQQIIDGLRLI